MPVKPSKFTLPKAELPGPRPPLWQGPCAPGKNGGVTFSMLSAWLSCKERFRVKYVLGLRSADQFHHRIEYGNLWHAAEEAFAAGGSWADAMTDYGAKLYERYPTQRQQVEHWYNVAKVQFPVYVEHWAKHPDVVARTPLFQEQVFDVPYKLPSGRTVRLRGKWDGVDLIDGGVYLVEHKTKGDIDEQEVRRQLTYDLQTMLYLVTLGDVESRMRIRMLSDDDKDHPVRGVRYNVVRRPLSGGRHTIKKHEPSKSNPQGESDEAFYARLGERIAGDPDYFFMRWTVGVEPADVLRFRRECLDPILEGVCAWYDYVKDCNELGNDPNAVNRSGNVIGAVLHHRMPFGAGGNVSEYGWQDVDGYLADGSEVGLRYRDTLFEELQ